MGRRGHGLLHIQDEGQLVVADLHQTGRLGGGNLIFRNDNSHIVAVEADMAGEEQAVRHILVVGIGAPGMPGGGEIVFRHVEAGEDLHHAGDLHRLLQVDGGDHAVGHGGVDQPGDQCALVAQIVGVLCPAGGLVKGVHPDLALAYALAHVHQPPVYWVGEGRQRTQGQSPKLLLL